MADNNNTPEFDRSLFDSIHPHALDVFYEAYPNTPVYFVTKKMGKACPLHYKALICTYTGWWHGLQGYNLEDKNIETWDEIKGYTVKDFQDATISRFRNTGHGIRMALTPEQYELIKEKDTEQIAEMILQGQFN